MFFLKRDVFLLNLLKLSVLAPVILMICTYSGFSHLYEKTLNPSLVGDILGAILGMALCQFFTNLVEDDKEESTQTIKKTPAFPTQDGSGFRRPELRSSTEPRSWQGVP